MKNYVLAVILLTSALAANSKKQPPPTQPPETIPAMRMAMQIVSPQAIRTHVQFLASDLLEGRGTGQRGGDIAAEYIATQFSLYGLKPAGDNGTYLQNVPMVAVKTLPATSFKLVPKSGDSVELKNLDDYVTN